MIYNAQKTKYPALFKDTYWGGSTPDLPEYIYEARNAFVERFAIVKVYKGIHRDKLKAMFDYSLDHLEMYRTDLGEMVGVCGNYSYSPPSVLNMEPTVALYSPDARSYFKVWSSIKSLSKHINGLNELALCGELQGIMKASNNSETVLTDVYRQLARLH